MWNFTPPARASLARRQPTRPSSSLRWSEYPLPLKLIAVACQTAHQRGVPVTAHLELVDADAAIRAGLDGVEYVTSFGTALAEPDEAQRFRKAVSTDNEARRKARYELWSRLDLHASTRVRPLIDLIAKRKIFLSPTLAVFERRPGDLGVTEIEARGFENMLEFVRLCIRSGMRIVVGSHSTVPKADLVLFDGSAFKDNHALRQVERVMLNGRWITPQP